MRGPGLKLDLTPPEVTILEAELARASLQATDGLQAALQPGAGISQAADGAAVRGQTRPVRCPLPAQARGIAVDSDDGDDLKRREPPGHQALAGSAHGGEAEEQNGQAEGEGDDEAQPVALLGALVGGAG